MACKVFFCLAGAFAQCLKITQKYLISQLCELCDPTKRGKIGTLLMLLGHKTCKVNSEFSRQKSSFMSLIDLDIFGAKIQILEKRLFELSRRK